MLQSATGNLTNTGFQVRDGLPVGDNGHCRRTFFVVVLLHIHVAELADGVALWVCFRKDVDTPSNSFASLTKEFLLEFLRAIRARCCSDREKTSSMFPSVGVSKKMRS